MYSSFFPEIDLYFKIVKTSDDPKRKALVLDKPYNRKSPFDNLQFFYGI